MKAYFQWIKSVLAMATIPVALAFVAALNSAVRG
jgi:hypothetical protein